MSKIKEGFRNWIHDTNVSISCCFLFPTCDLNFGMDCEWTVERRRTPLPSTTTVNLVMGLPIADWSVNVLLGLGNVCKIVRDRSDCFEFELMGV